MTKERAVFQFFIILLNCVVLPMLWTYTGDNLVHMCMIGVLNTLISLLASVVIYFALRNSKENAKTYLINLGIALIFATVMFMLWFL